MGQLRDRVAFITGGSRGIGLGLARAFVREGARVVIASRGVEVGNAAVAAINREFGPDSAFFSATDVGNRVQLENSIDQALERFGPVGILVNNATPGEGHPTRLELTDSERVEQVSAVNFKASLWAMQRLFPSMRAAGWGRIISMGSLNGINAHRFSVAYNSAKEAQRTLTRTAAAEWGRHGITCNVICPAAVTEPWQQYVEMAPEAAGQILEKIPMGRLGDCEVDIAPLAVFLASDAAGFITGNTIHADGGGHINGVPWFVDLPE